MGSESALLEAIYAAPERDAPRLVYADWLLERQDPRGELIQLQVAQARQLRRSVDYTRLQERIDSLWEAGRAGWTPKVTLADPRHFTEWTFKRGFATKVHTVASAFVLQIDDFFAAAPLLDEVQLDCGALGPLAMAPVHWIERLFSAEAFRRVKTLRLLALNDTGAVTLSGLQSSIEHLDLGLSNLGTGTYGVMGSAGSQLLNLRGLELLKANARDVALERLFEHRWPRLQLLTIGHEVVGERGIRALTDRDRVPALKQLDLSWSHSGGVPAMEALAGCQSLPALEELNLSHTAVSDAMCLALSKAKGFGLRVLRLAHAEATGRGIDALLDAPCLSGLALLELTGTSLDEATRERLSQRLGERVLL